LLLSARAGGAGEAAAKESDAPLIVSTAWLAEHLHDPQLVVFHVGSSVREYKKGHVPGARFLWTQSLAQSTPELTLEIPPALQADSVISKLGVDSGVRIVLTFAGGNISPVTRVLFTLDYMGLRGRVSLLDGGLDVWKAEGRPVSQETPSFKEGSFRCRPHPSSVVDADWIMAHRQDGSVKVVDARGAQFYKGQGGGMPRAGHIPGAVSIPFSSVVDSTNKFKDEAGLARIFSDAGIRPGDTVVTYCHIGQQATVLYLTARRLGHEALLYDGSFEDWSMRDELPVAAGQDEKPAAGTPGK
jgi:thiosulfate/3-mercaptopyruvate sulfurtransferase